MTPAERSLRARIASATWSATHDTKAAAAHAREGKHQKRLAEVDAYAAAHGETLTEAERERRAQALQKVEMAKMSLANSKKRAKERAVVDRRRARRQQTMEVPGSGGPEPADSEPGCGKP